MQNPLESAGSKFIRFDVALPATVSALCRLPALFCGATLLLSFLAGPSRAADSMAQQVEAVDQVVLGILSYVRWPHEPATLNLCVVGPTEYADNLLRGMVQASGRRVTAQRRALDDTRLGAECNVIYLGALNEPERQQVSRTLAGHAVLSIAERDPQCSVGSVFCLEIRSARVSFSVNLDSAARSGVRVHPSVLKLAKRQGGR